MTLTVWPLMRPWPSCLSWVSVLCAWLFRVRVLVSVSVQTIELGLLLVSLVRTLMVLLVCFVCASVSLSLQWIRVGIVLLSVLIVC